MNSTASQYRAERTLRIVRGGILLVLLFEMIGLAAELLLLEHFEDYWMQLPLYVLGGTFVAILALAIIRARPFAWLGTLLMLACIAAGGIGSYLHYESNSEFKLEMEPDLAGWDLVWQSMHQKNPPPLAPGAFMQLGLLGLIYTLSFPCLTNHVPTSKENRDEA